MNYTTTSTVEMRGVDVVLVEFTAEMTSPKPISINAAYSSGPHGRRFLTAEGRHFKDALREVVSKATLGLTVSWKDAVDAVYKQGGWVALTIDLYFDDLRNASWKVGGGSTAGGKPRSPYRKVDAPNYEKLISDAIGDATGIDDSCVLRLCINKLEDTKNPRVSIHYRIME
jgi:Holliday junction resolvase RusA-like endonuclease